MAYIYPFPSQIPSSSLDLPATLISLEDWTLVNVEGPDSRKYLQGQLTCDIDSLDADRYTYAAHCDAKGKVWSNILLFATNDNLAYLERTSVSEQQISELKKYAVFSKVAITPSDNRVLLGFAGQNAREELSEIYADLPDQQKSVVHGPNATILHFSLPAERFMLIVAKDEAERLFDRLLGKVGLNDSRQWLALDIEAGLPIIDLENSAQFLPQSLNLQALDAISFTKGCYSGQEMVARAKYRGANKRALYWLCGKSEVLPSVGEDLELKMGDSWRRTGTVLAVTYVISTSFTDETVWIQAVLNNDLAPDAILRVREDEISQLTVQDLPYSLEEEK